MPSKKPPKVNKDEKIEMRILPEFTEDEHGYANTVPEFAENEHGYVNTGPEKISLDTLALLPSRNIDDLIQTEESTADTDGDVSSTLSRRNKHYNSLRFKSATLRRSHSLNKDIGANKVFEHLLDDSEESKVKQLRDMHLTLTLKRKVKRKLDAERRRRTEVEIVDGFTRFKFRVTMICRHLLRNLKSLSYLFDLWHIQIKSIQGRFGSGVASYFLLLRWLLYLNVVNFLITFCFVVLPQLIYDGSGKVVHHANVTFKIQDLLTGEAWMSDTIFFFGHYTNETKLSSSGDLEYHMTAAYLSTLAFNVILCLVAILYSWTSTYDANYIETSGVMPHAFSTKIFCGWDYTIETEDAAKVRKQCFYQELMELINKEVPVEVKETLPNRILPYVIRIALNILILSITASIGYLTYFLLKHRDLKVDAPVIKFMALPLTVTAISRLFFYVFKFATVKVEYYNSKRSRFYLTIGRVMFLRTVMIGVIVYFWLKVYAPGEGRAACYETMLGSELYRLVLVNFFIAEIGGTFIGEYLRKVLFHRFFPSLGSSEFDVAYNILDLIYYQALVWIGEFSCPMLPFFMIIILVWHFYLKSWSVSVNCVPSRNAWTVSQAKAFFLTLSLIMFLITEFVVYYIIFTIPPSYCGPLMNYDSSSDAVNTFMGGSHPVIKMIKGYIFSEGFMFTVVVVLVVVLYFSKTRAGAFEMLVHMYQHSLKLVDMDTSYLLKLYDNALKEEAARKHIKGEKASQRSRRPRLRFDLSAL